MPDPLAYHIYWRTYGTWLPGDERGWVDDGVQGIQEANVQLWLAAREQMSGDPVTLSIRHRYLIEGVIRRHCEIRRWTLHAQNARTNHIHVVVTALGLPPDKVRDQFKAWCSRRLNERCGRREWWALRGGVRWINSKEHLHAAIKYVLEGQ